MNTPLLLAKLYGKKSFKSSENFMQVFFKIGKVAFGLRRGGNGLKKIEKKVLTQYFVVFLLELFYVQ